MKMSTMVSVMALTHEGHLAVALQMFSLLKIKHNRVTVFDPVDLEIDETMFPTKDWSAIPYGSYKEDVPSNDPAP